MKDKEMIEEIKQDFAKHEEEHRQIEEIQNALPCIEAIKVMYRDIDFAKYLYDRDIRKLPENSVVLSREEYEELTLAKQSIFKMLDERDNQARKETAEKILKEVGKTCGDYQWFKNLCKQYGVEIKE